MPPSSFSSLQDPAGVLTLLSVDMRLSEMKCEIRGRLGRERCPAESGRRHKQEGGGLATTPKRGSRVFGRRSDSSARCRASPEPARAHQRKPEETQRPEGVGPRRSQPGARPAVVVEVGSPRGARASCRTSRRAKRDPNPSFPSGSLATRSSLAGSPRPLRRHRAHRPGDLEVDVVRSRNRLVVNFHPLYLRLPSAPSCFA